MDEINALEAGKLITDKYASRILVATSKKPKNALELSERLGIPIAACYRKIHALENIGLLKCIDRVYTRKGKKIKIYESQLKKCFIALEGGKFSIQVELKSGEKKNFGGTMSSKDILGEELDEEEK